MSKHQLKENLLRNRVIAIPTRKDANGVQHYRVVRPKKLA